MGGNCYTEAWAVRFSQAPHFPFGGRGGRGLKRGFSF